MAGMQRVGEHGHRFVIVGGMKRIHQQKARRRRLDRKKGLPRALCLTKCVDPAVLDRPLNFGKTRIPRASSRAGLIRRMQCMLNRQMTEDEFKRLGAADLTELARMVYALESGEPG